MEKETENFLMEEESQDALVDYDSEDSVVKVIERERDSEETIRKDREEKEKKEETKGRGAIPKRKEIPKIREDITLTRTWVEDRPILPIGSRLLYEKQEQLVAKMDEV